MVAFKRVVLLANRTTQWGLINLRDVPGGAARTAPDRRGDRQQSSTAARVPTPGLVVYSAAKGGIEGFSRALAAEAAPAVRVNVVAAGPTLTERCCSSPRCAPR